MDEDKVFDDLLELDNKKLIKKLFNFYKKMEGISDDMTKVLNLLDEVSENCEKKKVMRGLILDSYNELPRRTLKFTNDLIKIMKE